MLIILEELMVYADISITILKTISLNAMDLFLLLLRSLEIHGLLLVYNVKQKYVQCTYKRKRLKLVMHLGL